MNSERLQRHRQRSVVHAVLLLFNMVLIVLQIWLFTATLENLLAGKPAMSIPAAVFSAVCAVVNAWMLIGLYRTGD